MDGQFQQTIGGGLRWLTALVLGVFVGIAGFFLVTEHTAHLYGALPYLFLLSCLFMHLFMHGSHGAHVSTGTESGGGHQGHEHERKDKQL